MKILVLNSHKNTNLRMLERHFAILATNDVISWNSQIKSAFDAFDEGKPDVVLFDASMKGFLKKAVQNYPSVRFVCEDNSDIDENNYDLTFTTIVNREFKNKKCIPIYFDIISFINKGNKSIYHTDVCINQNLHIPPNQTQFNNLFVPCQDVRINGKIRTYGQGQSGEYACGILNEVDQFAAYKQAKVCVVLKNFVNPKLDYEIPHHYFNMLKVNQNVIDNIPEATESKNKIETPKELLSKIQELVQQDQPEGIEVKSALFSCSEIMKYLNISDNNYVALDIEYRKNFQ